MITLARQREMWFAKMFTLGGVSRMGRDLACSFTVRVTGGREAGRDVKIPLTADEAEHIGRNLIAAAEKMRKYQESGQQAPYWQGWPDED